VLVQRATEMGQDRRVEEVVFEDVIFENVVEGQENEKDAADAADDEDSARIEVEVQRLLQRRWEHGAPGAENETVQELGN